MSRDKSIKLNLIMGQDHCDIRSDAAGDGAFGAKRGKRKHSGLDVVCKKGDTVLSPVQGVVTKIGWPYASGRGGVGDPEIEYRYVEITHAKDTPEAIRHRFFYVEPMVTLGQNIKPGNQIASAMDVSERYDQEDDATTIYDETVTSEMLPHIHIEIKDESGKYIDPAKFKYPVPTDRQAVRRKRQG